MARPSPGREASLISLYDRSQRLLIPLQIKSQSTTSELFLTANNSTQAGTGTCRVFGDARPYSDHIYSNSPFQTQIGVGKVIRGWDEGELLSIGLISPYPKRSTHTAVPQLSLGEKALLTVSPDYVSWGLSLVRPAVGGSSAFLRTGIWCSWVPTGHPTQRHPQVRSRAAQNQLISKGGLVTGDVVHLRPLCRFICTRRGLCFCLYYISVSYVILPSSHGQTTLAVLEPCFGAVSMNLSILHREVGVDSSEGTARPRRVGDHRKITQDECRCRAGSLQMWEGGTRSNQANLRTISSRLWSIRLRREGRSRLC